MTEESRKEEDTRYRALIENALDVITVLDADGTVRYVTPSVAHVLGYRPRERLGKNTFDLIHPDDVASVRDVIAREIQTPGSSARLEFRIRHKDGSWRFLEVGGAGRRPRRIQSSRHDRLR